MPSLFCLFDNSSNTQAFSVEVDNEESVSRFKELIRKKTSPDLDDFPPYCLNLWKWNKSTENIDGLNHDNVLNSKMTIGDIFKDNDPPQTKCIHIIVRAPSTISPSSSNQSNLVADNPLKRPHSPKKLDGVKRPRTDVEPWLLELHSKLWNQENLRKELFHTVEITAGHHKELQERLTKLRHSKPTKDRVLSIKLDVLRSFNVSSITPDPASDDEQIEAENNEFVDGSDDELRSLFPATIEFLDLSSLELQEEPPRMPLPLLVREEYKFLTKMLDDLPKNGGGSANVSGQPGIGKTAYIYLRLIESMITGCPFLFQTIEGTVYHVSDSITKVNSWSEKEAIIAFVDADHGSFEPRIFLRYNKKVQIIAASSPQDTDQSWLKQLPDGSFMKQFATKLWSPSELFLTGIFLNSGDLIYAPLKESTFYFGFNPRECFKASLDSRNLDTLKFYIKQKVRDIPMTVDIRTFFNQTRSSKGISHLIFQLSPQDNDNTRLIYSAQVLAVSSWALDVLLDHYEARHADATFKFYTYIGNMPDAGAFRGQMFERQILRYFDSLKQPHVFTIRSLTDSNTISQWAYPGPTERFVFRPSTFAQSLQSAVKDREPLHLVPEDPNFPAVDSILYHPHDVLTGIQVTIRTEHSVDVIGFKRIQGWLKRNIFGALRPSIAGRHWRLIFVVPDTIADSFTKQHFDNDTVTQEWAKKVDQYVLGIKESTIWGR